MKYIKLAFIAVISSMGFTVQATPIKSLKDLREEQVVLRPIWRARSHSADYFSSNNYTEILNFQNVEQVYYIPNNLSVNENRDPIFRLYNGYQHMASPRRSEGEYVSEGQLGFAWNLNNAPDGTEKIFRMYNPSNDDHAITSSSSEVEYPVREYFNNLYAYPRYSQANKAIECVVGESVELCSNKRAGGTVWSLTWNGRNFVNVLDYGRQIQSSLGQLGPSSVFDSLPTEGGDNANAHLSPVYWHGSPVALFETTPKSQKTRAIPTEWKYSNFGGGDHRPVVYPNWKLGKNVYLDHNSIELGEAYNYLSSQVIIYDTVLELPRQLGDSTWQPSLEIPTGYIDNGTGNFNRFFTIDASVNNLNEALIEVDDSDFSLSAPGVKHYQSNLEVGGVVVSTDNLSHAIGVYRNNEIYDIPNNNGFVYYTLWKFGNTNKWSVAYKGILNKGENIFRTYILVGSLDDVRVMMRRLYLMGY